MHYTYVRSWAVLVNVLWVNGYANDRLHNIKTTRAVFKMPNTNPKCLTQYMKYKRQLAWCPTRNMPDPTHEI